MKKVLFIIILNIFFFALCKKKRDPFEIIQKTVNSIDTIRSISYNQQLIRTDTVNTNKIIKRDQSFIYEKLPEDSITGVKAHIYYYSEGVCVFEDIYDGSFLFRKNNFNKNTIYYDMLKYPEIKKCDKFWRKNSPYTMQALLDFILKNKSDYKIRLLNDTLINNNECFCIQTILNDKTAIPGFNPHFTQNTGYNEISYIYINKNNFYPIKMRLEIHERIKSEKVFFTDHQFSNIIFNPEINNNVLTVQLQEIRKNYQLITAHRCDE